MNKSAPLIYISLFIAIAVVFVLIIKRHWTTGDSATDVPASESNDVGADRTLTSKTADSPSSTVEPRTPFGSEPVKNEIKVTRNRIADVPVSQNDMTPLLRSEIADKWISELGYFQAEIVEAQKEIRAKGYPEESVNDPGIVMRHLPPRHLGSVSIEDISVPADAKAGRPIPFTIRGTAPSPSFNFTHFDVLIQGDVIRIRARGNSDSDTEAGTGSAVTLQGRIDPLPPGTYRVEIPELGPNGSHQIVVTE